MKHYKATHETSHVQHGHALIETLKCINETLLDSYAL